MDEQDRCWEVVDVRYKDSEIVADRLTRQEALELAKKYNNIQSWYGPSKIFMSRKMREVKVE
jgi:hypothetical protein